jgi:Undecaprenyl-phosphate glucose phosphotransferase
MFYLADLYRFEAVIRPRRHVQTVIAICGIVFLLLVTLSFALKVSAQFSRIWAFSWLLSTTLALCLGRILFRDLVYRYSRSGKLVRNLVIVGAGTQAQRLLRHFDGVKEPWNRVVGVFDDRIGRTGPTVAGHPVLGNIGDLVSHVREHHTDDVLIALPWSAESRITTILDRLRVLPVHVGLSPDLVGMSFSASGYSRFLGLPVLDIYEKPLAGWDYFLKGIFDRGLGTVFLIVSLPLFMVIALSIKLDSPGPVFFRQQRYGFNNRLIPMLKFRTMRVACQDDDAERLTSRNDERVTRVGWFLRRTSLDELPQLINVLKGEMSIVGPRPHALRAKAAGRLYDEVVADYALRHRVKPGITGWAQVNGWRGDTDTSEKITRRVEHDLYYIDNWSLRLDLFIILRTVWVCVRGKNAY